MRSLAAERAALLVELAEARQQLEGLLGDINRLYHNVRDEQEHLRRLNGDDHDVIDPRKALGLFLGKRG